MTNLNPANNEYAKLIDGMDKRIRTLENTTQQQQIDWFEINLSNLINGPPIGLSTDIIVPKSIENLFTVGDKLRLLYSDNTQINYFVVKISDEYAAVDQTLIYLATNGDTPAPFSDLVKFSISNIVNPTGFEGALTYTANVTDAGFNVMGTIGVSINMSGNTVSILAANASGFCDTCTVNVTNATTELLVDIPFNNLLGGSSRIITYSTLASARSSVWSNATGGVLTITRPDGSDFPISAANSINSVATFIINS